MSERNRNSKRFGSVLIACALAGLLAACGSDSPPPTATPTETATATATLTPVPSSTSTPRPSPTATESPAPSASPTATREVVTVEPVVDDEIPPPLAIELPDDWSAGYSVVIHQELDGLRGYPVAVYTGPVTDADGTIVVVWGFPTLRVVVNPVTGLVGPADLWSDGSRLWRLLLNDVSCNIGIYDRTDYTVGGLDAVGTQIQAINCPDTPDVAGWFAGLEVDGISFLFYAYITPREAYAGQARRDLEAILDTVDFRVSDLLTTTPTPRASATVPATAEATDEAEATEEAESTEEAAITATPRP